MKIVLASHNPGKIREFRELLLPFTLDIIPQDELQVDEPEEIGMSFIENALLKARHAAEKTGLPAIADDSGLVVTALGGAPGIHSARFAGTGSAEDNIAKLLDALKNVPDEKRQAYFYCALAFVMRADDPVPLICTGKWHGRILSTKKGLQGFGYDPVFFVPELNVTAAELPAEVKNKLSHRGLALRSFLTLLPEKIHESTLC
jgi:XTP/dITP diphosphohydrolase